MKFQDIPLKIVKRLSHHIYKLAGKDSISGAKILGRNDLKELGSEYGGWVIPSSLFRSDSVCYCVERPRYLYPRMGIVLRCPGLTGTLA